MRASVVINTYNRGRSLRQTLRGLRQQTHPDFEVIVVRGPCTDETDAVLAEFAGAVRVADCPEVHLSRSRNIGIRAASGEVVAFIDDDAIPEPNWLADLLAAYDSPRVGGTGGIVYEPSGFELQYKYSICDRTGGNSFEVMPPFDAYVCPGADPFIYLQGTNTSFRRECLAEIGGFDEEIEYYLDEVEVCMRVIDLGYTLKPLANAVVHHKYLASHLRNDNRVVFDPYAVVKNRYYYAIQNGTRTRTLSEVLAILAHFADAVRAGGEEQYRRGGFTAEQRAFYLRQIDRAMRVGLDRGVNQPRFRRELPPPDGRSFLPYPTLRPEGKRLTICFLSQEYPPADFGGIGRFTCDLATGLAALGHEVHVITRTPDTDRVDLEDGVWLHRLEAGRRYPVDLDRVEATPNLEVVAAAYHEVCRIHARGPVDLVSTPLWQFEGLLCALDGRFPAVLTLMTSLRTIADLHPSWAATPALRQLLTLEGAMARHAHSLHAISAAILEKVRHEYGVAVTPAAVVPLGIRDRSGEYRSRRAPDDPRVRILFVGRLERRKGVDLLLQAAVNMVRANADVEFILAGKDTSNTETGATYREAFGREHGGDPELAERVRFAGAVSEDELYQLYADADIFCLPSRYESFGLVLLEAMMFGKPVVGCAAGGMREIIEPDGNGFLAEPENAASLEECLRRLVNDPELRRRFGARSRRIYEAKYTAEIMAARTLAYYRAVAAAGPFPARAGESRAARLGRMVGQLAGIIAGATGVLLPDAERMARGFLSGHKCGHYVDYLTQLRHLLHRQPGKFVSGVYQLLLNREEEPRELAAHLRELERGMPRGDLIEKVARSEEARRAGLPTEWWLASAMAWGGSQVAPAAAPVAPPRRTAALRARLKALPLFGKAMRYLKRLVYLPWNFEKLYYSFYTSQDSLRQLIVAQQSEMREAVDKQTQSVRDVLERQIADLRGEVARAVLKQSAPESRVVHPPERRRSAA